jgi:hypothetical protein
MKQFRRVKKYLPKLRVMKSMADFLVASDTGYSP